jgi:tRNA G46 methylase TrmB
MYPEHVVIGVDRSQVRLAKQQSVATTVANERAAELPENSILIRAELVDFWRCCIASNLPIERHFLLYPNPNPKSSLLSKRWYGHPSFPLLLQLGKHLTVRSNWKGYLEEFAFATNTIAKSSKELSLETSFDTKTVDMKAGIVTSVLLASADDAWTNFEAKFHDCGEPIYELVLERG